MCDTIEGLVKGSCEPAPAAVGRPATASRQPLKGSDDLELEAEIGDGVGPYLHPPAKAEVLRVDEEPQVQAQWTARGHVMGAG